MKTTSNLGLRKPEGTDVVNIDDLNHNADILDIVVQQAYDLAEQAFQLGNERKQDLVDALIAIGVSASTGDTWDDLLGKVASVIRATGNATAADVRAGIGFSNASANGLVGTLPVRAAVPQTITPGTSNIVKDAGIYDGAITILGDPDLVSANIKAGTNIFGVQGKTEVVDTSTSAGATAAQILSGREAFVNGAKVTGSMPNRAGDTSALSSVVSGTTLKLLASQGYRDGVDDYVTITDPDFIAANIRSGVNLFGLLGTLIEGKPFATGSGSSNNYAFISVRGLAFRPAFIIMDIHYPVYSNYQRVSYSKYALATGSNNGFIRNSPNTGATMSYPWQIFDDGFDARAQLADGYTVTYTFWAWGE